MDDYIFFFVKNIHNRSILTVPCNFFGKVGLTLQIESKLLFLGYGFNLLLQFKKLYRLINGIVFEFSQFTFIIRCIHALIDMNQISRSRLLPARRLFLAERTAEFVLKFAPAHIDSFIAFLSLGIKVLIDF